MAKGRLLKGRPDYIDGSSDRGALIAPGAAVVVEGDKLAPLRLVKTIVLLALGLVAVAALVYTFLGATLMAAVPEEEGYTWVQRSTFVGGIPAKGDYIYASTTTAIDTSAIGRLKETYNGLPDAGVFQVVAGPFGKVAVDPATGAISVDGKPTGFSGSLTKDVSLNDNYLTVCINSDGACKEGNLYLIDQVNISGEAKYDVQGVGKFEPYGTEGS